MSNKYHPMKFKPYILPTSEICIEDVKELSLDETKQFIKWLKENPDKHYQCIHCYIEYKQKGNVSSIIEWLEGGEQIIQTFT